LRFHYQHVGRFASGDEYDADGERQSQVLGERLDVGIDCESTCRQVHLYTSLTGRHLDSLHLVFLYFKRGYLARVDEVDTILDSTATDLALTETNNNKHVAINIVCYIAVSKRLRDHKLHVT